MPRSKLEGRRAEIRELYLSGLSTTAIAKIVGGCTYGAIGWLVRDIIRPKSVAISLSKPPKSLNIPACRARARGIVRRALGQTGETRWGKHVHVHHKDGDPTNNDIDNLEVIHVTDHIRLHNRLRRQRAD